MSVASSAYSLLTTHYLPVLLMRRMMKEMSRTPPELQQ